MKFSLNSENSLCIILNMYMMFFFLKSNERLKLNLNETTQSVRIFTFTTLSTLRLFLFKKVFLRILNWVDISFDK